MTTDPLDVRFPPGRQVCLMPTGDIGTVWAASPGMLSVQFPAYDRVFMQEWFERCPTALRLLPNVSVADLPSQSPIAPAA